MDKFLSFCASPALNLHVAASSNPVVITISLVYFFSATEYHRQGNLLELKLIFDWDWIFQDSRWQLLNHGHVLTWHIA